MAGERKREGERERDHIVDGNIYNRVSHRVLLHVRSAENQSAPEPELDWQVSAAHSEQVADATRGPSVPPSRRGRHRRAKRGPGRRAAHGVRAAANRAHDGRVAIGNYCAAPARAIARAVLQP